MFLLVACNERSASQQRTNKAVSIINKQGATIEKRFNIPKGYKRISTDGFGKYLRALPLQNDGANVHLYNGEMKGRQDVHAAVVNIDVGKRDLQQCADAVMRLRAEYLYGQRKYDWIHFNFTNGFRADYYKWLSGHRIKVKGNSVRWVTSGSRSNSYASFRAYLDVVFSYAGTLSLSRELKPIPFDEMSIGDVLIKGGSPGHAVIVVDIAEDKWSNKLFMLAQSYMPAQEIHVLKNFDNTSISPWYSMSDIKSVVNTPEWNFTVNDLRRFKE